MGGVESKAQQSAFAVSNCSLQLSFERSSRIGNRWTAEKNTWLELPRAFSFENAANRKYRSVLIEMMSSNL